MKNRKVHYYSNPKLPQYLNYSGLDRKEAFICVQGLLIFLYNYFLNQIIQNFSLEMCSLCLKYLFFRSQTLRDKIGKIFSTKIFKSHVMEIAVSQCELHQTTQVCTDTETSQ